MFSLGVVLVAYAVSRPRVPSSMYAESTRRGTMAKKQNRANPHQSWKPTRGLEPRTPSLRVKCSTN